MTPPGGSPVYPPRITVLPPGSSTCPGYQRPAFIRGCSVHTLVQGLKVKARLSPPKFVYPSFEYWSGQTRLPPVIRTSPLASNDCPEQKRGAVSIPWGPGPSGSMGGGGTSVNALLPMPLDGSQSAALPRLMGSSGNDRPQNITSPVGSMTALMATWGISKGARVQRPTSLGRPGALAGLRELFGLAAVLRRHLPLLARRQPLQLARLVGLGGSLGGVLGGVLGAQEPWSPWRGSALRRAFPPAAAGWSAPALAGIAKRSTPSNGENLWTPPSTYTSPKQTPA